MRTPTWVCDVKFALRKVPGSAQSVGDPFPWCQTAARTATAAPSKPGFGCVITCTAMRRM